MSTHKVCPKINAENSNCSERKWNVSHYEEEKWCQFWNIRCKSVGNGLLQVIKYKSSYTDEKVTTGKCSVRLLVETHKPSSTPVTIEAKLSSSSIISAACFDTSEPVIPIATPEKVIKKTQMRHMHYVRLLGHFAPASTKRWRSLSNSHVKD